MPKIKIGKLTLDAMTDEELARAMEVVNNWPLRLASTPLVVLATCSFCRKNQFPVHPQEIGLQRSGKKLCCRDAECIAKKIISYQENAAIKKAARRGDPAGGKRE